MKTNKSCLIFVLTIIGLFMSGTEVFPQHSADQLFEKGLYLEEAKGELQEAIDIYNTIVENKEADPSLQAKALLHMGLCFEKLGMKEAAKAYQRLVNTYPDQTELVALAKERLVALGGSGGASGLVTRRVLTDASGLGEALSSDGKYISQIDRGTGDVIQIEIASGKRTRITNRGPWSETEKSYEYGAISHNGKQIAYNTYTKDGVPQVWIRNLDGSGLRTLYSEKSMANALPVDWSSDAGSILALCSRDKSASELTLISTADGSVRVLKSITSPSLWLQGPVSRQMGDLSRSVL